jgi:Mg2+/Co2+ transporter CorB
MITILILPLLAFFLLSAFFALSETAIFASNKYKVRHLASQGSKPAQKLVEWLESPDRLLATLLLGNNFANIGAATVSAAIVSRYVFDPQRLNIALAAETVVLTLVILLFCEGPGGPLSGTDQPESGPTNRNRHASLLSGDQIRH